MGFLTSSQASVATYDDPFSDPVGALETTIRWRLLFGSATPGDIAAFGTAIYAPTGAAASGGAYLRQRTIERPYTFRMSLSAKIDSTPNTAAAGIILARSDASYAAAVLIRDLTGDSTPDNFYFEWRGQITSLSIGPLTANTYYRLGLEVDVMADVARAYLNITNGSLDSTFDSGLAVYATYPIESGAGEYGGLALHPGLETAGASVNNIDRFTSVDNLHIEEFLVPFSAAFPGPAGAFFSPIETPYSSYKSSSLLHARLNQARFA